MMCCAKFRKSSVGLTKAAMVMMPVSTKSLATSATRRIFSRRSSAEKPKLALMPVRMLSPSSMRHSRPRFCNSRSRAMATVLLPLPLSPVNHSITPFCPSSCSLSWRDSMRSNMGYMLSCVLIMLQR
ncbi:putative uncharacterized protein [Prevotella sp. CAG:5226]|nr:putative uncharacterized protein [Prevotella sp. CAG:5226]